MRGGEGCHILEVRRCLHANRQPSKEDTMALRVPKAQLPAELRENMIKQLGAVPEPVEVSYNNPKVAMSSQQFSAMVATWDAVEASLKTFAHMAVAAQVGC